MNWGSTRRQSRSGVSGRRSRDLKTGPKAPHSTILDRSRGGDGRHVPTAHAAAARRLPLRPAAVDPASDPVGATPMPPAARHLPTTRYRGRQAKASALPALSRSASSTWTSPRCRPPRASSTCSSASTAPASSRSPSWSTRLTGVTAWEFLEHLLKAVPYRIHTILTDNGIQFAEQPRNRNTAWSRQMRFDMICEANEIEHRLTKPNHPWTNGQVERMNRTIKEATVKRFHYESHDQLRTHLADFMAAYNFARPAQDAKRSHSLRIHRQDLDVRARPVHRQSDPPDAGTKHLVMVIHGEFEAFRKRSRCVGELPPDARNHASC